MVIETSVRYFDVSAVALLLGTLSAPLPGQTGKHSRIELGDATAIMSGFERIRQIRELEDGTLLVLEGRRNVPLLVDMARGTSSTVSRVGDGPGEFRQPSALIALKDDSTAVVDLNRWVLLHRDQPVATLRAWLAGMYPPTVNGVDEYGRILEIKPEKYGAQAGVRVTPSHRNAVTLLALLHKRGAFNSGNTVSGAVDTIARLRGAFNGVRRHTIAGRGRRPTITYELVQELATDDQAILFPDGWLAIAYWKPYKVDWRDRNGQRVTGALLPFERVRVDEVQKRATIARGFPNDSSLFASKDFPPWPEVLPPFLPEALLRSPDGSVVIRRTADGRRRSETTYDVVNRRGVLTHKLILTQNKQVAGFGKNGVYVVSRDQDGVQTIERYQWPLSANSKR